MDIYLQNYQAYLDPLLLLARQIYSNQYFQQIVIAVTFILFFILGRIQSEKKLTNLLEMVNDAEATRKNLKAKLQNQQSSYLKMKSRRKYLLLLTVIIIIANLAFFYLTQNLVLQYIAYSLIFLVSAWILFIVSTRWLSWKKNSIESRLKSTSLTAQTEIKQILNMFGPGLKTHLKSLFEADIQSQWTKESKQQCKLYKCYNEKKIYEDLYKLYEEIIDEIKKTNMCDICLGEDNISVQKLGLADMENTIRNCKKAKTGKLTVAIKKQMVNKLLAEYQKIGEKLPNICKKGCCIKQRVVIQNAKAKYHERLKKTISQLSTQKRM